MRYIIEQHLYRSMMKCYENMYEIYNGTIFMQRQDEVIWRECV